MPAHVNPRLPFVDIHCHLVPGIDDGAAHWDETLAMAKIAVADGVETIIVTPHQLGNFSETTATDIRVATAKVQEFLRRERVPLRLLPGGDVRVEADLLARLRHDEIMTLADHRRHLLLELPHELYFDLRPVMKQLKSLGIQAILSHPERNHGLLAQPELVGPLVDSGCLMQVTCGSLLGTFGPAAQAMSEQLLAEGLVHFLASDGHGPTTRRPRMFSAFARTVELAGLETAERLCCIHPASVAAGEHLRGGRLSVPRKRRRSWFAGGTAA